MNILAQAVDFQNKPKEGLQLLNALLQDEKNLTGTVDFFEITDIQRHNYHQYYNTFEEADLLLSISKGAEFYQLEDVAPLSQYLNLFKPDLFKSYKKEFYLKEKEEDEEASFIREEFNKPLLLTLVKSDAWFITLAQYQLKQDRASFTQYIYDKNIIGDLIGGDKFLALDYLKEEGFNFNHVNEQGMYPIFSIKSVEAFEYLKEKNIDWDVVGAKKKTVISFISRIRDASISRTLFNRIVKLLKNGVEEQIVSGIIENFSQKKTQGEILNSLKKFKKPLAEFRDEDENNLFLLALKNNNVRIADKLLSEKLDFEHVNANGEKALDFAMSLSGYRRNDSELKNNLLKKVFSATNPFADNFAETLYLKNIENRVNSYSLPMPQMMEKMKQLGINATFKMDRSYHNEDWASVIAYFEHLTPLNSRIIDKVLNLFVEAREDKKESVYYQFLKNDYSTTLFNRFYDKDKMDIILEHLLNYTIIKQTDGYSNYMETFLVFCDKVGFDKLPGKLASQIDIESIQSKQKEYYQTQIERRRFEDVIVIQDKVVKRRKI